MAIQDSSRDILIELRTDIKYIKKNIDGNSNELKNQSIRINILEDWQEGWNLRTKMIAGIASFIGGIMVFIASKLIEFFSKKA